jgi:hypothetical protein
VDDVRPVAKAGSWLCAFPVFARAFADGILTLRHVRDLKALDKPRTRHGLLKAQGYLVELARDGDYRDFSQGLTYWLNAADPDGDEPREQVAKASDVCRRQTRGEPLAVHTCTMTRHSDGSVSGKFYLDPLSAAAVGTALEDEAQRLFHQQTEQHGRADTPRQRRGQALVGLMIKGAGVPGSATTTPLVNLVMGWELFQNLVERLDDPTIQPVEVDVKDPNRRCELIDGTPIHPCKFASGKLEVDVRSTAIRWPSWPWRWPSSSESCSTPSPRPSTSRSKPEGSHPGWKMSCWSKVGDDVTAPPVAPPYPGSRPITSTVFEGWADNPCQRPAVRRCLPQANSGLPCGCTAIL